MVFGGVTFRGERAQPLPCGFRRHHPDRSVPWWRLLSIRERKRDSLYAIGRRCHGYAKNLHSNTECATFVVDERVTSGDYRACRLRPLNRSTLGKRLTLNAV